MAIYPVLGDNAKNFVTFLCDFVDFAECNPNSNRNQV